MRVLPWLIAVIPLVGSAAPNSPQEAKQSADKSESALSASEMQGLVAAQAKLASKAFPACTQKVGPPPKAFTVVVELAPSGTVAKSWLIGNSPFALCFNQAMVASFTFNPPTTPFFTAFEYEVAR